MGKAAIHYKTRLEDALAHFQQASVIAADEGKLAGIHDRLRADTSASGAQRIEWIRQLAEGPGQAATRHLQEIAGSHDFYSAAEIAAALAALQNLADGKPNHDLQRRVEAESPARTVEGLASVFAMAFFYQRPGPRRDELLSALIRNVGSHGSDG